MFGYPLHIVGIQIVVWIIAFYVAGDEFEASSLRFYERSWFYPFIIALCISLPVITLITMLVYNHLLEVYTGRIYWTAGVSLPPIVTGVISRVTAELSAEQRLHKKRQKRVDKPNSNETDKNHP